MNTVEELGKYLIGLDSSMPKEFFMLAQILQHRIFELCLEGEKALIPYMMNDAVECYLVLDQVVITGEQFFNEPIKKAKLTKRDQSYGMILYQKHGHVFTIWFESIKRELHCYQYHQIAHFWEKGQEQWRQLVYIIGTIYEKHEYLGEKVCNPLELDVMPLIEFAPFRRWSPMSEPLDDKYPNTYEGIDCMENFALAASDYTYARLLRIYRRFPLKFFGRWLSRMLLHPRREALYHLIWNKVEEASSSYPHRAYPEELVQEINRQRAIVDEVLKKNGCEGVYPNYRKEHVFVRATEEHPFTVLEADDFTFQIQLMISECKDKIPELNSGFFQSRHRRGTVIGGEEFSK
ncbi:MAG: DUF3878 family protein [Anaerostipes sp.]|jgi:hypothetical protein|nr:DUF3878 family protein [Anaerostipes sp.]